MAKKIFLRNRKIVAVKETLELLKRMEDPHDYNHRRIEQAEVDSEEDFERLKHLLRENLYSWWN